MNNWYITIMLYGVVIHGTQQEYMPLSALPPTPFYENVHAICMQLWNDIEILTDNGVQLPIEHVLKQLDSAIGQLVYVYLCINHMRTDKTVIAQNHAQYLMDTLRVLHQAYYNFFNTYGEYERMLCINYIIHKIYKELAHVSVCTL